MERLLIFGGIGVLAYQYRHQVFSWVSDKLTNAVNFKVLSPSDFDPFTTPGQLSFNFNYALTNPSAIPLRIESLVVKLYHEINNQWVQILENSLEDQTRTIIIEEGRQENSHRISVPISGSILNIKNILLNRLTNGQQRFRLSATAKVMGSEPITHTQDFTL